MSLFVAVKGWVLDFRAWVEAFNFIFQVYLDGFLSERAQSQEDEAVRRLFSSREYVESVGKEDMGSSSLVPVGCVSVSVKGHRT